MDDLATARLTLHPMTPAEAERVVAGAPGESDLWAPGYPAPLDVSGARTFLQHCASTGDPQPFGDYQIRRREDGHAIGGTGFNKPPEADGSVSIGYCLIPSERGKGYASEALRRVLRLARECGISRVTGDADLDNTASHRVMTAVGMRCTGEDERVRYYELTWSDDELDAEPVEPRPEPLPS